MRRTGICGKIRVRAADVPLESEEPARQPAGNPARPPRDRGSGSVESSGRGPHIQGMYTPGRHKKYLVVSASLLTRS